MSDRQLINSYLKLMAHIAGNKTVRVRLEFIDRGLGHPKKVSTLQIMEAVLNWLKVLLRQMIIRYRQYDIIQGTRA